MADLIPAIEALVGGGYTVNLDADTYNVEAELDAWAARFPSPAVTPAALEERAAELEISIEDLKRGVAREAALFLDMTWGCNIEGTPEAEGQALIFPLVGCLDQYGRAQIGVPLAVKRSHAFLWAAGLEEALLTTRTIGVLEDTLGPIKTVTVATGAERVFEPVGKLMGTLKTRPADGDGLRIVRIG